jgi:hypothetical protein
MKGVFKMNCKHGIESITCAFCTGLIKKPSNNINENFHTTWHMCGEKTTVKVNRSAMIDVYKTSEEEYE